MKNVEVEPSGLSTACIVSALIFFLYKSSLELRDWRTNPALKICKFIKILEMKNLLLPSIRRIA